VTLADSHLRRFEILREIASGGFGTVFLCRVTQADGFSRVVAVKLLHPQWSENQEVSGRMRDEARLLGLLSHRNIVDVFDLTRLDGRVAVVMEYLEAIDLKTVIKSGAVLPLAGVLQLGSQVASALDAAFNKAPVEGDKPLRVVHRDIKPSNIMIDSQGSAKVLDFGVARGEFDAREAETRGMAFGSFEYMPSERRFMESGGETSDVYSLGAVLYELLAAGEKLGKGKLKAREHGEFVQSRVHDLAEKLSARQASINPRTVQEISGFMERMLAFDAEKRPTPAQVASVLRRLARAVNDATLEEWAETHVPPLLATARARQDRKKQDPLVGQVLVEERTESDATPRPVPGAGRRRSATPAPQDGQPDPPSTEGPAPRGAADDEAPQAGRSRSVVGSAITRGPDSGSVPRPPITSWDLDIPKRVRDAAPSRPPLTGTQTPAPLRRAARRTPPTPPVASVPDLGVSEEPSSPPAPPERSRGPGALSNILYVTIWVLGLLTLGVGAVALLVAAWFTGQG